MCVNLTMQQAIEHEIRHILLREHATLGCEILEIRQFATVELKRRNSGVKTLLTIENGRVISNKSINKQTTKDKND
jgi:hypothetical protein